MSVPQVRVHGSLRRHGLSELQLYFIAVPDNARSSLAYLTSLVARHGVAAEVAPGDDADDDDRLVFAATKAVAEQIQAAIYFRDALARHHAQGVKDVAAEAAAFAAERQVTG